MKFINKVMVFVMGLVVIGVVSTTVGVVTQAKTVDKNVTFELLENDGLSFNVFDKINGYVVLDIDEYAINLVNVTINNEMLTTPTLAYFIVGTKPIYNLMDGNSVLDLEIHGNYYIVNNGVNVGDTITITFAVEVETPVIIKTLLVLIPLILSAGLIGYLVVKKGDE